VQDVSGKRLELLCRFTAPLQDGVGGDLEDPCGAPDTSTLGQAHEDAHDEVDGGALAVKDRAESLEKRAATGDTPQLPPGTAARMAIGAAMAPAHPAPIGTVWVGAEMRGGIHLAATTSRHDEARWRD